MSVINVHNHTSVSASSVTVTMASSWTGPSSVSIIERGRCQTVLQSWRYCRQVMTTPVTVSIVATTPKAMFWMVEASNTGWLKFPGVDSSEGDAMMLVATDESAARVEVLAEIVDIAKIDWGISRKKCESEEYLQPLRMARVSYNNKRKRLSSIDWNNLSSFSSWQ
jgi:hypothetical protein